MQLVVHQQHGEILLPVIRLEDTAKHLIATLGRDDVDLAHVIIPDGILAADEFNGRCKLHQLHLPDAHNPFVGMLLVVPSDLLLELNEIGSHEMPGPAKGRDEAMRQFHDVAPLRSGLEQDRQQLLGSQSGSITTRLLELLTRETTREALLEVVRSVRHFRFQSFRS